MLSKTSPRSSVTTRIGQIHIDQGSNATLPDIYQQFPMFTTAELDGYQSQFATLDKGNRNAVRLSDLQILATTTGEALQSIVLKLNQLNLTNHDGTLSFESFLTAVAELRGDKSLSPTKGPKAVLHTQTSDNSMHTINEDEKQSFVEHINQVLANDVDLEGKLPIDARSMNIFPACQDGLLLAKLINVSVPGTIDERVLNMSRKLNTFQMTENNNVVVNSAKAIGCSVVNIGAQDLIEGREHLILGLIWQIIKIGLQAKIDIKQHPELFRLLEKGEKLEDFMKRGAEQTLCRWLNFHLEKAGFPKKVTNFTNDVKDGEAYYALLSQLAPNLCVKSPHTLADPLDRADLVLSIAGKMGCRKYLTAKTLVEGNAKLNFAFVANLFNKFPGLETLSDAEMTNLDDSLFNSEGSREARVLSLWLNSLNLEPFVNDLFDDLRDGLILLQAIDRVRPGSVNWRKVNKAPVTSKFKKVENTNYVVLLGKSMKFTLVGIQGSDITDGQRTLTLGLVWQLMREHVIQTLKKLSHSGKDISEKDMVDWANDTVRRGGKTTSISQLRDLSLRSGLFLLDLLNGIRKGAVNYELVSCGTEITDEAAKMNAKYAISIARKLGATIFVLPEDIVEVRPKMILTFVGTLMALDQSSRF
ncbi:calponin homology domain-containing protein [Zopfochytrium polystomum]|nr:calponin homology domain-containing protein [Zopfochytrium polystomum]